MTDGALRERTRALLLVDPMNHRCCVAELVGI